MNVFGNVHRNFPMINPTIREFLHPQISAEQIRAHGCRWDINGCSFVLKSICPRYRFWSEIPTLRQILRLSVQHTWTANFNMTTRLIWQQAFYHVQTQPIPRRSTAITENKYVRSVETNDVHTNLDYSAFLPTHLTSTYFTHAYANKRSQPITTPLVWQKEHSLSMTALPVMWSGA